MASGSSQISPCPIGPLPEDSPVCVGDGREFVPAAADIILHQDKPFLLREGYRMNRFELRLASRALSRLDSIFTATELRSFPVLFDVRGTSKSFAIYAADVPHEPGLPKERPLFRLKLQESSNTLWVEEANGELLGSIKRLRKPFAKGTHHQVFDKFGHLQYSFDALAHSTGHTDILDANRALPFGFFRRAKRRSQPGEASTHREVLMTAELSLVEDVEAKLLLMAVVARFAFKNAERDFSRAAAMHSAKNYLKKVCLRSRRHDDRSSVSS